MPWFQVDRNGNIFAILLTLLFVWLFFERGMDKLKYFWFAYVAFIWLSFFAQIFFFDGINYYFANIDSFFFLATAPTLIFSGITVYKLFKLNI